MKPPRGFTLLIAILVIGIILAIGLSILNITLKEYLLSGVARESAIALNAADAGMECALYWDRSKNDGDSFDFVPSRPTITCMGETESVVAANPGNIQHTQNFKFTWGTSPEPTVCADVTVTKYYSTSSGVPMGVDNNNNPMTCPQGVECTLVVSLGYNKACSDISSPRTVERGLRARY